MILFIGVALSTAYSCNKDDDDDDGGGGTTPSKCYIKKEVFEDGSYAIIEYNSSHHVTKRTDYDDAGSASGYTLMTYANDKLASMESYESGTKVAKFEYSYNAAGKPTKADLYTDDGTGLTKIGYFEFTFTGDNMTKQSMHMDLMGQTIKVSETEFTFDAGNVTRTKAYAFNAQTLQLELQNTIDYTYDTKINPYHGIGIDYLMGDPQLLSIANIVKMIVLDDKGAVMNDESYNMVYEYNDTKYPTKGTATSFDNSNSEVTIMEYDCI